MLPCFLLHGTVVILGCIKIGWSFFLPVVCSSNTSSRVVALTFDDGPNKDFTPFIIDTLSRNNIKATFFCIGKNIPGNEDILKRMELEGHTVGNHSNSHHFWFDLFSARKMLADMQEVDKKVYAITGRKLTMFRPPYGITNPNVAKAIKMGNYTPVGWNIRSLDTVAKDKKQLLARIESRLKPGAIILLHDSIKLTSEALPEAIAMIRKNGYDIVPLSELFD